MYCISTNIISPLGFTTEENYNAVRHGKSMLKRYAKKWNLQEPFVGSILTDEQVKAIYADGLTKFESMVVRSVEDAMSRLKTDIRGSRVLFVLSSTKGNVELLEDEDCDEEQLYIGATAGKVAKHLNIECTPIAVCNACISGVSAIILAERLLREGRYDYAIVTGADSIGEFISAGFQSLKAMSGDICKPFDIERCGLNLGEAAATMILSRERLSADDWKICGGYVRNDAFHISSPSKDGDGSKRALEQVMKCSSKDNLAQINAHGTATMYNDQMESVAIERAGLADVPVNGLKGYYGHTLGAAGVIESILTMRALDDGIVLSTRGYEERGVSGKIDVVTKERTTSKKDFVKMLSGFGGCNAAVEFKKEGADGTDRCETKERTVTHTIKITQHKIEIDGENLTVESNGKDMLAEVYKSRVGDYAKFYKMDMLSKLSFIATELLLNAEGEEREAKSDRAVVLFNRTSSTLTDIAFQKSISDKDNYFPSPSIFVYTLPNISTGEIAIRNKYNSETSFYLLPDKNDGLIKEIIDSTFEDEGVNSVIGGWVDVESENEFTAEISIIER